MSLAIVTATIPGTGSVSAGVILASQGLIGVAFPGNFADAPLSFLVDPSGAGNWSILCDQYGNEVAIPSRAGQQIGLDPEDFTGYTAIKVRSGTSADPVVQPSDAVVELFTAGAEPPPEPSPLPNPRRTIDANNCGLVGTFAPYWSTEDDVATFELEFILATGETISEITTFGLTPEDPGDVTDPAPDDRILGPSSIVGTQVSQRFGNWQADITQILYRVDMICVTSRSNTLPVYAYVYVNAPPSADCASC